MVEYSYEEAVTLLEKNLASAIEKQVKQRPEFILPPKPSGSVLLRMHGQGFNSYRMRNIHMLSPRNPQSRLHSNVVFFLYFFVCLEESCSNDNVCSGCSA